MSDYRVEYVIAKFIAIANYVNMLFGRCLYAKKIIFRFLIFARHRMGSILCGL
ncbi:unknown [[Mannheimia] succiniciproducens MBEL55E]|uniref:Uncharacterized protein n=1 Tax=Mannheimia succiniciproducens (strain KCTC 0769BP / MBEL55E) TaxID=221988 RepID=Q65UA2_MANSM|nr:unknown [[Mannheimia] succiniciproducens MBEL55E]